MQRRTKIVATLGPASSDAATLTRLLQAGVDVVRLNFSHGTADDHRQRVETLRQCMRETGRTIAIMVDLQGPKIRVGKFAGSKVLLKPGQEFILDATCSLGDHTRGRLDYPDLIKDIVPGNVLLLDDGRIVLDVEAVEEDEIFTRVRHGGELSNNKGINLLGGGLSAPALTPKDIEDMKVAAELNADLLAISFPKSGQDILQARELLRAAGSDALVIAKVERAEAIEALESIVEAADGIMVARGDLAVEVGDASVPALQKRMIRLARENNKLTITATQMMESMISSPIPTRAEVSDVANAVLDGTDAVMLSAETAAGSYPVETVESMARVCVEAEKYVAITLDRHFLDRAYTRIDQSIAMGALFTAYHLNVKAIASLTQSGSTALWMSRLNVGVPIYALTEEQRTRFKAALYRGVYPVYLQQSGKDREQVLRDAEEELVRCGAAEPGDLIVITYGEPIGSSGGTNTLKIIRVGERAPGDAANN
jgi:pyruvate kinase